MKETLTATPVKDEALQAILDRGPAKEPTLVRKVMDPIIKSKWVAALRSGKYKKARGRLRDKRADQAEPMFCVLGLLCEIMDPDGWDGPYHQKDRARPLLGEAITQWAGSARGSEACHSCDMPSTEVLAQAGLPAAKAAELMRMNDGGRKSFEELADFIEHDL